MKTISCAIILSCLSGCISAQISEPSACDSKSVFFYLSDALSEVQSQLPSGETISGLCAVNASAVTGSFQLPPLSTSTDFDFSSDLKKIDDVANSLTVQVNQLMLDNVNNEFGFVFSVEVDMQGQGLPSVVLATYTASKTMSSELNVDVKLNADKVLSYLEAGSVTLSVTLNSKPVTLTQLCRLASMQSLGSAAHMCIAASGSVSKSL
jgi:hypothetical protein